MKQTPEIYYHPIPCQDSKKRHMESDRRTTGMATLETEEVNTSTRHPAREDARQNWQDLARLEWKRRFEETRQFCSLRL